MGHSDLATTMGYAHLLDEHLLALVEEPSLEELREVARGS
jgi:site-specific recombinase XerD